MASESTEEETLTVSLPGEVDEWLTGRADELGVDRETVLLQLLASYRAADELGDEPVAGQGAVEEVVADELDDHFDDQFQREVEEAVASVLAETLDDRVESAVESQVRTAVEEVVADRLSEATESVRRQLGDRVDALEEKHVEDIEDVRGRVVQLKRELDGKAAAGHDHEEFERVGEVAARLDDLEATVEDLEGELDSTVTENGVLIEDLDERLDTLQDRLKTVAWVVSDLRDAYESGGGMEAVERIKRAAAKADIERAKCESCGEGVAIGLLTDPECPHCQSTVTNVEPASSWFGNPRLLTASQLESGDEE